MLRLIGRLKMRGKLAVLVGVPVLGILLLATGLLFTLRQSLMQEKELKTKHVVEAAYGVLQHFHALQQQGTLKEDAARATAIATLREMRYDGSEYFWLNDLNTRMIMHALKPEMEGKEQKEFKDPTGKQVFVEFVETVKKQKAGFVQYLWPKPGKDQPVLKVSYVQGFEPWGWVIGSGIYVDDVDDAFWAQTKRVGVGILLLVGGVGLVAWIITRGITGPLAHVEQTVNTGATGDLTVRVDLDSKDELGQMGQALNAMLERFETTIREVQQAAQQTANAAQELAAGSEQLSSGAQEQASALEETAASLEEITGTITQNADNAKQANQLAAGTKTQAEAGGQIVTDAVTAMAAITTSSKQIAAIIGTIDEIAFQTNLLALNAAVEAARAGEQGRGFAVVATEVRALAQRAAAASKEIKALITDSVQKVESGSELVIQTGDALNAIVGQVKKVADLVAEITAASSEQATGIGQVNKAVTQMDGVTQQNAAQTEELSGTAQSLAAQAEELQASVAQFKLSGGATRHQSAASNHAPQRKVVALKAKGLKAVPASTGTDGFAEF